VSEPPPGSDPVGLIFRGITDARVHERVVDQITFAIRSGAIGLGERLPSVEQMATEMGVSKPTVLEAIRVLSNNGVVESRRGVHGGVTVTSDDIPITLLGLPDGASENGLRELLEARRPVEMEIARLAGQRADESDLAAMRDSIDRLESDAASDGTLRLRYDHFFHYAMARAARSNLLAHYQHQILEGITKVLHDFFVNQESPAVVIDLHRRTLEAIRKGSAKRIDAIMDEHLARLEREPAARD
jgi:GntR family transcriptional regulator, transcriptional repressor for pyruvate dehydrogenase complex